MKDTLSRRGFLGTIAAVGAGAAAAATPAAAAGLRPPGWRGDERVVKIPTTCEMCFWRCGVLASVAGGRVVRLEGNPDHPLTKGRLCARGNAGTGLLYDPDRLKYPLLRTGERGEGQFKRISWDEALDFLAARLKALREMHGPETVAFFPHGAGPHFFSTLMQAYGTPNSAEPAFAQCRGPREVGYSLTFGRGLGSPEPVDLEHAKLIVLIGSHIGENVFTSQITAFAEGRGRGAKLVVADPRFSTAASKADWWLPIRPGTDIALLLAWIHVLIDEGLYDREYMARYAQGFDALAAHVRPFTPGVGRVHHRPPRRRESATRRGPWARRSPPWRCIPGATPPGTATTRSARARWPSSPRSSAAGAARAACSCRRPCPAATPKARRSPGPPGAAPTAPVPFPAGLRGSGRHQRPGRGDGQRRSPIPSRGGSYTVRTFCKAFRGGSRR